MRSKGAEPWLFAGGRGAAANRISKRKSKQMGLAGNGLGDLGWAPLCFFAPLSSPVWSLGKTSQTMELMTKESSQILLVPIVLAWIVWVRRERLKDCRPVGRVPGMIIVGLGWLLMSMGNRHQMQSIGMAARDLSVGSNNHDSGADGILQVVACFRRAGISDTGSCDRAAPDRVSVTDNYRARDAGVR